MKKLLSVFIDGAITMTYYSSADMFVLDKFTVYKVDSSHLVVLRKALLDNDSIDTIDYNEDGEINIIDLVRLKKLLANVA